LGNTRDAATHLRDDERDREHERFAPTHRAQRQAIDRISAAVSAATRDAGCLRLGSLRRECLDHVLVLVSPPVPEGPSFAGIAGARVSAGIRGPDRCRDGAMTVRLEARSDVDYLIGIAFGSSDPLCHRTEASPAVFTRPMIAGGKRFTARRMRGSAVLKAAPMIWPVTPPLPKMKTALLAARSAPISAGRRRIAGSSSEAGVADHAA
jgi:hypothetical protein